MTTTPRFEHDLPILLEDLYLAGTPDYRDDLVQRLATTRQRPAWPFPERWLPMDITTQAVPSARMPWRQLGVLAILLLVLAVALVGIVGSQRRLAAPFGPAANGQLVYVLGDDVVVRDAIDGQAHVIVSGPEIEVGAGFSPRGDRLLVLRASAGGDELWVGDPDGTDLVRVDDGPYQVMDWVEFSPDGTLIAVQHDVDGQPVVDLVASDGSGTRRLTDLPAMSPTFRPPDGRQLLFRGEDADGRTGFYLVDVAGGDPVRLAIDGDGLEGGGYDLQAPAWSPTGDRLAFHSLVPLPLSAGQTNGFRIRVASIDPSGAVTGIDDVESGPTPDDELNPVFTQDGRQLLYQQRYGLFGFGEYTDTAWILDLADGRARSLGVETKNGDGFLVSVAPDDGSVLIHLSSEQEDWQVDRVSETATRTDLGSSSGAAWQRVAP